MLRALTIINCNSNAKKSEIWEAPVVLCSSKRNKFVFRSQKGLALSTIHHELAIIILLLLLLQYFRPACLVTTPMKQEWGLV